MRVRAALVSGGAVALSGVVPSLDAAAMAERLVREETARRGAREPRVGLAVMFVFTAIAHFNAMRADLVKMVPPWVPAPGLMVTFTGLCEIAGAVGLLIPATRPLAAVALIVFLLAVLPANVHAARAG